MSTARRACKGRALRPHISLEANTGELFASGFQFKTPYSAELPTFIHVISQACPLSEEPKKKIRKKKVMRVKAVGEGFKGFVDWGKPITSELAKENEDDMSIFAAGFSVWMRKQAASSQGETTPDSQVPSGKRPKRSSPDREV